MVEIPVLRNSSSDYNNDHNNDTLCALYDIRKTVKPCEYEDASGIWWLETETEGHRNDNLIASDKAVRERERVEESRILISYENESTTSRFSQSSSLSPIHSQ